MKSLLNDQNSKFKYLWKELVWLRPQQFIKGKISLFQILKHQLASSIGLGKFITPYDILQGTLGDCYFLSSLSILATVPSLILDLFITKKINPFGIYCVKICYNGLWVAVYVDDCFPCYNSYQGPAFSMARENEIWVLIFEKAWAKLFRNYENIISGTGSEVMHCLTGAPTEYILLKDKKTGKFNAGITNLLKSAFNGSNTYFVTSSTEDEDIITKQVDNQTNLTANHAYSILGYFDNIKTDNGIVTLVKIRNPWGKKEWTGRWSKNSKEWTAQIKKQINASTDYGGVFFMELSDFEYYFQNLEICYYVPNSQYTSVKLRTNHNKAAYVEMEIHQSGNYSISLIQKSKRCFPQNSNYEFSAAKICLIQIEKSQKKVIYINQIQNKQREMWFNQKLEKGIYMVYCKVKWFDKNQQSFVLSTYGPENVTFNTNINKQQLGDNKFLMEAFKNNQNSQQLQPLFTNNDYKATSCLMLEAMWGIGSYYIFNNDNKRIRMQIRFQNMQGLKLRKPFRGNVADIDLKPHQDLIILFSIDYSGYSLKYTIDNIKID